MALTQAEVTANILKENIIANNESTKENKTKLWNLWIVWNETECYTCLLSFLNRFKPKSRFSSDAPLHSSSLFIGGFIYEVCFFIPIYIAYFLCFGKSILRDYGISWLTSHIFILKCQNVVYLNNFAYNKTYVLEILNLYTYILLRQHAVVFAFFFFFFFFFLLGPILISWKILRKIEFWFNWC